MYLIPYNLIIFFIIQNILKLSKSYQGPNAEGSPYIWLDIQALAVFDTKETCKLHAPKIFDVLTKLTGQPKENIHLLLKPLEKHNIGVNGTIKE